MGPDLHPLALRWAIGGYTDSLDNRQKAVDTQISVLLDLQKRQQQVRAHFSPSHTPAEPTVEETVDDIGASTLRGFPMCRPAAGARRTINSRDSTSSPSDCDDWSSVSSGSDLQARPEHLSKKVNGLRTKMEEFHKEQQGATKPLSRSYKLEDWWTLFTL